MILRILVSALHCRLYSSTVTVPYKYRALEPYRYRTTLLIKIPRHDSHEKEVLWNTHHPLYCFMRGKRGKILAPSSGTATIGVTDLIGYRKQERHKTDLRLNHPKFTDSQEIHLGREMVAWSLAFSNWSILHIKPCGSFILDSFNVSIILNSYTACNNNELGRKE